MRGSSRRGYRPRLGQHFLRNARTVEKILDALGVVAGETVVEVGPGRGALTRPLLSRGARVLAYELDRRLAEHLRVETVGQALVLHERDALQADMAADLAAIGVPPPIKLVGNLPYESATAMIRAFVRRPGLFSRIVVMVQKEVADRLLAPPGGDAFGFLTLDVGAHARAEKLFDVSRGDFDPPPKVVSTILCLRPEAPPPDGEAALEVASAGFTARRKTLRNALAARWGAERARAALAAAGLPAEVRAEELGLPEFRELAFHLRRGGC